MVSSQPQLVDLFAKLILLVAQDSDHWEHAADSCENFIQFLSQQDQEKMALNCAFYRERARLLRDSVTDIMDQIDGYTSPDIASRARKMKDGNESAADAATIGHNRSRLAKNR